MLRIWREIKYITNYGTAPGLLYRIFVTAFPILLIAGTLYTTHEHAIDLTRKSAILDARDEANTSANEE